MVWFECTDCGESLKKPKVQNHTYSCSALGFNCIDCGRTFDRHSVKEHTTCVTEHDKYAKGATKPGGFAAQGFYGSGESAKAIEVPAGPSGLEFLATRAPWVCGVCNVTCTSSETLMGHAAGAKHKRRVRAASKGQAEGGGSEEQAGIAAPGEGAAVAGSQAAPSTEHDYAACSSKATGKKRKHGADTQSLPSSKVPKPGTSSVQQGAAAQQSNGAALGSKEDKGYKWKKLAEKVLQARGGDKKMKMRKLQLKVLSAAGLSADLIGTHGDVMLRRWQKSRRRFCVQDGYVSLKQPE